MVEKHRNALHKLLNKLAPDAINNPISPRMYAGIVWCPSSLSPIYGKVVNDYDFKGQRTPKPQVAGSSPVAPATILDTNPPTQGGSFFPL